jgi:hypothetical protein
VNVYRQRRLYTLRHWRKGGFRHHDPDHRTTPRRPVASAELGKIWGPLTPMRNEKPNKTAHFWGGPSSPKAEVARSNRVGSASLLNDLGYLAADLEGGLANR